MSRRGMRFEDEDDAYDYFRQREVDAESAGEEAAKQGKPSDACPPQMSATEGAAWHRGWLRETVKNEQKRRVA